MQTIKVERIGTITQIIHRDSSDYFGVTIYLDRQEREKLVRDLIGSMDGKEQVRLFGRYAAASATVATQYPNATDHRQMNDRLQQVLAQGEHLDDLPGSLRIQLADDDRGQHARFDYE